MTLINCTAHTIDLYPSDTPDEVPVGAVAPRIYRPSGYVARIREVVVGRHASVTGTPDDVPIELIEFGHVVGLPKPARRGTFHIVSLAVALALPARRDLVVPQRPVYSPSGKIVGCRALAMALPAVKI